MILIPIVNTVLGCNLSKEEVIRRMEEEAHSNKIDGLNISKIYWGDWGENVFEIVNRIDIRNGGIKSYQFTSKNESTKINMRFKFCSRFLYIFSALWILGNIALFAGWLGVPVYFDNKFFVSTYIIGFPLLFYLKDLITFYRIKEGTIYHIKTLLDGEIVS